MPMVTIDDPDEWDGTPAYRLESSFVSTGTSHAKTQKAHLAGMVIVRSCRISC